ncbi:CD209 antigen-like protein C [Channa argus]|uniref:CD209 antigen-like protein C n=1 Tax=Channa argus TaxID=215402 RepID=UPI003522F16A
MEEIQMKFKNDRSFLSRSKTTQRDLWSSERRIYRAVVFCLGLLSVFLLTGLFIFNLHYHNTVNSGKAMEANMNKSLQDSRNNMSSLTEERRRLTARINFMTAERDQLNATLSSLTEERRRLTARINFLTAERGQQDVEISSLTEEKDQLDAQISNVTKEKDQLKSRLIEMTKDRDRLESLTRKTCPAGWTMFSRSFYFLSTESGSWTKAREDCQNKGADLVIVTSAEEQEFLSGFTNQTAWIGLTDIAEEGTWKWVDGSLQTFRYWDVKQPDNLLKYSTDGEDCAEIKVQTGHKWNDVPCGHSLKWICEKNV